VGPHLAPVAATRTPFWRVGQIVRGRTAARVYSGPGAYYQRIDALAPRERLQIVHWQDGWVQVAYPRSGLQMYGWVDGGNLAAQSAAMQARSALSAVAPPSAVMTVVVAALHLRRGPATTTSVLALLKRGTRLVLLGRRGAWDRVRLSAISGWVIADAVTLDTAGHRGSAAPSI
jgi:N-acetylmuramoyl-L-alanine amidase